MRSEELHSIALFIILAIVALIFRALSETNYSEAFTHICYMLSVIIGSCSGFFLLIALFFALFKRD